MQMKVNITRKRTITTYKFCIIIERWWLTNQLVTKLFYELESTTKKIEGKVITKQCLHNPYITRVSKLNDKEEYG